MLKILHVTEAFAGGVTSAINTYVAHSQQHEHFLFATTRDNDTTGEEGAGLFSDLRLAPRKLSSLFLLRDYIATTKPDVVHLHSTYAGFLVRALPFFPADKTIYTPHGFSFLRDDHPALCWLYRTIEKMWCRKSAVIAGCGLDEVKIAREQLKATETVELMNVCGLVLVPPHEILERPEPKPRARPKIGMVGRVTSQKGFEYFAQVAKSCNDVADFVWIGGGGEPAMRRLAENGVFVTGWMTRLEVLEILSNLDLYFHSAAWDGFPISVLEAAQLDVPILLREIGPFISEGLSTVASVQDAIVEIRSYVDGVPYVRARAVDNIGLINARHSSDNLSQALQSLYSRWEVGSALKPQTDHAHTMSTASKSTNVF